MLHQDICGIRFRESDKFEEVFYIGPKILEHFTLSGIILRRNSWWGMRSRRVFGFIGVLTIFFFLIVSSLLRIMTQFLTSSVSISGKVRRWLVTQIVIVSRRSDLTIVWNSRLYFSSKSIRAFRFFTFFKLSAPLRITWPEACVTPCMQVKDRRCVFSISSSLIDLSYTRRLEW